ncbi:MAG: hypothetical protein ACHQ51_12325 [Elusimicrobiota bacterium]
MKLALLAAALLLLPGCRGTVPPRDAPPEQSIAAILIGGRMILPTGESRNAYTVVNFESEGGEAGEVYRLPIKGGENALYLVEPGTYRILPTRSLIGYYQEMMKVVIEGRTYRLPFPRELLRLEPYKVKASKIVTLGVVEARVLPALPGRKPEIRVRLDDSAATRRAVVQDMIREMMDPNRPIDARQSAISWSRALQNSLLDILSEQEKAPMYKPAQ